MKLAKRFAAISMPACSMLACLFISGDSVKQASTPIIPEGASAKLTSEVRLRKLHLVRPDLIGYPVIYEIFC